VPREQANRLKPKVSPASVPLPPKEEHPDSSNQSQWQVSKALVPSLANSLNSRLLLCLVARRLSQLSSRRSSLVVGHLEASPREFLTPSLANLLVCSQLRLPGVLFLELERQVA